MPFPNQTPMESISHMVISHYTKFKLLLRQECHFIKPYTAEILLLLTIILQVVQEPI